LLAGDSGYLVFDYLVGASGRTASIAAKALMQLAWLALLEVSQAVRHHFLHSLLQVFAEILKRQNEMVFAFLFLAIGSGGKPPWDRRREGRSVVRVACPPSIWDPF
jgi:hypothetical protein